MWVVWGLCCQSSNEWKGRAEPVARPATPSLRPVVRRPEAPVARPGTPAAWPGVPGAAAGRGGAPRASLHETSSLRLNFSEAS